MDSHLRCHPKDGSSISAALHEQGRLSFTLGRTLDDLAGFAYGSHIAFYGLGVSPDRKTVNPFLPGDQGFGLAGMIALLVPFANLLLGPALVAGGTLLVLSLEPLGSSETTEIPPPEEARPE